MAQHPHPSPRPSPLHEDAMRRLDRRVHDIYLMCEAEHGDLPDDDFIDLVGLRVECDPESNRLVRLLRAYIIRNPEAA